MAKKGYHSLYKKSKSSSKGASKVKKAARKASGKQASRAESTFRQQPKATKQPKMSREQRKKQLVPYKHSMEIAHRPMQILILGHDFPEEEEAKA